MLMLTCSCSLHVGQSSLVSWRLCSVIRTIGDQEHLIDQIWAPVPSFYATEQVRRENFRKLTAPVSQVSLIHRTFCETVRLGLWTNWTPTEPPYQPGSASTLTKTVSNPDRFRRLWPTCLRLRPAEVLTFNNPVTVTRSSPPGLPGLTDKIPPRQNRIITFI